VSEESVEVVKRYLGAWSRQDLEAVMAMLDPEFELDLSRSRAPYQGIYRGHAEIKNRWDDLWDSWEEIHLDLGSGEFIAAGDQVVAVIPVHLRSRETGIELPATAAMVCTIRDRRIIRHQMWQSREEALEATGLSVGEVSRDNTEIVRLAVDAFNKRDLESVVGYFAPNIDWHDQRELPGARVHHGPDSVLAHFRSVMEDIVAYHFDLKTARERGDQVVICALISGRGRKSGVAVEREAHFVYTLNDESIMRVEIFGTEAEALEAAGLSE
jgi:ketosteroid isomerase-like protein